MSLNYLLLDIGKIIGQFIFDILYFPIWWYSKGFLKILTWSKNFLVTRFQMLAIAVWIKNIFTPMYGQRDWAGMIISFLTRLIQILVRMVIMVFWFIYAMGVIALWICLPLIIGYQILFQLNLINSF